MRKIDFKNRNYIIIGLCIVLVFMAVGFAAFAQSLQINGTSSITSNWCVGFDNTMTSSIVSTTGVAGGTAPTGEIEYTGNTCGTKSQVGAEISAILNQPGDSLEYTLTILNEGSLDAKIDSITVDGTSVTKDTAIQKGNIIFDIKMPYSSSISAGSSTIMKVVVKFQNNTDVTGMYDGEQGSISVKINATQDSGTGGMEFTNEYTFAGQTVRVATKGDGLYYDENANEYYYRGANPNNYIEFNGEVWRIMSINSSGNLKIIKDDRIDLTSYSGKSSDNLRGKFDAKGNNGRRTSGYCSNSYAVKFGCNAWAAMSNFANTGTGAKYSSGPVTEDSELNSYLNGTYKSSLSGLSYVQTGMTWNVGHAGVDNDTLSVSELEDMEKSYTWIGDIALPTKSEYIRAHGNSSCLNAKYLYDNYQNDTCKTTNYLYKSDYEYWLLSPYSTDALYVFVTSIGTVNKINASDIQTSSVRPVLHLKSNITLSGNGGQASEDMYRLTSGQS